MKSQLTFIGQEKTSKKGKPYMNVSFMDLDTYEQHNFVMVFGEDMINKVSKYNTNQILDIETNKNFLNDIKEWDQERYDQLQNDIEFVDMFNKGLVFIDMDIDSQVNRLIKIQEDNMFILNSDSRYHGLVIEMGDDYRIFLKDGIKTKKLLRDLK